MLNEIKPEQVPKEAIAKLRAFLHSCDCDDCVAVAIAAALSAWPGMWTHEIIRKKMCGLPLWIGNKNE